MRSRMRRKRDQQQFDRDDREDRDEREQKVTAEEEVQDVMAGCDGRTQDTAGGEIVLFDI